MQHKRFFTVSLFSLTLIGALVRAQDKPLPEEPRQPLRGRSEWGGIRGRRNTADGGGMRRGMNRGRQWLARIKEEEPEKFAKLMKLREDNPEEFREQIRTLMMQRMKMGRAEMTKEEQQCRKLHRQYHDTEDPEAKARIRAEIKSTVETAFAKRLEKQKARLAKMEQEIARIREYIQVREKNQREICDQRIEELTRDPKLNWDAGH